MKVFKTIQVLFLLLVLGGALALNSITQDNVASRIVGGNEATIEENPWQVSLQKLDDHICGGCIISENAIVTAAQCIYHDISMLELLQVRVGTADLDDDGSRLFVGIESATIHERYTGVDYDIAVIMLKENLTLSDRIQPIALPQEEELDVGSNVNVTGWGATQMDNLSIVSKLRSVTVEIIDKNECYDNYSEYFTVTDRMVCAGVPEWGKGPCQGDAGGPLSANGILYGLTSSILGCGVEGYPGVYTNVVNLVLWVKETAGIPNIID